MNKTVKGIIWGTVILGVGVGVYYGVRAILGGTASKGWDESPSDENSEASSTTTPLTTSASTSSTKRSTDPNRWLKSGSKDSSTQSEVEYLQHIYNKIIGGAKDTIKYGHKMAKLSENGKNWVKAIATLNYLKADGDFGAKTTSATRVIMGATAATSGTKLCKARKKRQDFNAMVGAKEIPYQGSYWKNKVC